LRLLASLLVVLSLVGCAEPLSDDLHDFVGLWKSGETMMTITEAGEFAYETTAADRQASVAMPILSISDTEIVVGAFFVESSFQIEGRPASRDGLLSLVVDGEVLHKMNPAGTGPIISEVPTGTQIEAIVRKDIQTLHQAMTNLDFKDYWNSLSPVAQSQIDPEGLHNNYRDSIAQGVDLGHWLAGGYLNRIPPSIDEKGILFIQGALLQSEGQYLGMEARYVNERGEWLSLVPRLFTSGYEIRRPAPAPAASIPAAPAEATNESAGLN